MAPGKKARAGPGSGEKGGIPSGSAISFHFVRVVGIRLANPFSCFYGSVFENEKKREQKKNNNEKQKR